MTDCARAREAWAIISIFLCWIFAIAAIVNAVRVDDLVGRGRRMQGPEGHLLD